jgi:tRNA A37 threonylcarbamoyltransferase TsaD
MIALAGHYRLMAGQANDGYEIAIRPRWNLEELQAI